MADNDVKLEDWEMQIEDGRDRVSYNDGETRWETAEVDATSDADKRWGYTNRRIFVDKKGR
uniref:Uncharacterized protein n=1 Tax=Cucumis melo TaxID=3656 RepID=A0A9I9CIA3_CUCME